MEIRRFVFRLRHWSRLVHAGIYVRIELVNGLALLENSFMNFSLENRVKQFLAELMKFVDLLILLALNSMFWSIKKH